MIISTILLSIRKRIFKSKSLYFLLIALALNAGLNKPSYSESKSVNSLQFISYWFSWGASNSRYAMRSLRDIPAGVNVIMIGFALEKSDESGLMLQLSNYDDLRKDIAFIHKHSNTQVILSTGGARGYYPWASKSLSNKEIASQFIDFINENGFDGIDFDIENGEVNRIVPIVSLIKAALPNLYIALTVPSASQDGISPHYNTLAANLNKINALNTINLMNYDNHMQPSNCSYKTLDLNQSCYIRNIQATERQIAAWAKNGDAKKILSNGIMIGYADDGELVTVEMTRRLTQWLKDNNYAAVMTWGLSRDQSSETLMQHLDYTTGTLDNAVGAYTKAIIDTIKN